MGWSVYVQIVRDKPLTAAERKKLAAHAKKFELSEHSEGYVFRVAPEDAPGGVIAMALGKWGREPDPEEDDDAARMYAALTELRTLFRRAKLEVADDYNFVGWDGEAYGIVDEPDQKMTKAPKQLSAWIEVPAPRPPPKPKPKSRGSLDARLEAALAGAPMDATVVELAFEALERGTHLEQIEKLLAACSAAVIVDVGLSTRWFASAASKAIGDATARLDNLDRVRHRLVQLWFETPAVADWSVRAQREHVMTPAMRDRHVVAELGGALVRADLDSSRAEQLHREMIGLLVKSERGLPYAIYRRRIDRETPQRLSDWLLHEIVTSERREILPTLAIELGRRGAARDELLLAMRYVDDPRKLGLLERALETDQYTRSVTRALWYQTDSRADELLRRLSAHIDPLVRILAAQGLVARHGDDAVPVLLAAVAHAKAAGIWEQRRPPGWSSTAYALEDVRRQPLPVRGSWPASATTAPLPEVDGVPLMWAPERMQSTNPDVRRDTIEIARTRAVDADDRSQLELLRAAERRHVEMCEQADVAMTSLFSRDARGWDEEERAYASA